MQADGCAQALLAFARYGAQRFQAKEINGEKVPLMQTRKILDELWNRSAAEINMDHVTKKLRQDVTTSVRRSKASNE